MTEQQDVALPTDDSSVLAKEWVEHLKDKAKKLTLMLAVVGIAGLIALIMLFIVYDRNGSLNTSLMQTETALLGLQEKHQATLQRVGELEGELEKRQKSLEFLEQLKGDTASQLEVAQKIIDTQAQKIELIEGQYASLQESKTNLESQLANTKKSLASASDRVKALSKDVEKRKSAYTALVNRQKETRAEVDRLAGLLSQAEKDKKDQLTKLSIKDQTIANLKSKLNEAQAQLTQVKTVDVAAVSSGSKATADSAQNSASATNEHRSLAVQPIIAQPEETESEDGVRVISSDAIVID